MLASRTRKGGKIDESTEEKRIEKKNKRKKEGEWGLGGVGKGWKRWKGGGSEGGLALWEVVSAW